MRLKNRRTLLIIVIVFLTILFLILVTRDYEDDTVETTSINKAQEFDSVSYNLDEKVIDYLRSTTTTTIPPTTTTTTTTTIPPTTTTTYLPRTTVPPPPPPVERPVAQSSGVNWDAIAACESGNDWSINTGNGYYGGLQFSHSTWIAYGGGQFAENAHLTSRENQIAIASGMSLSHWPVCGKRG